MSEQKQEPLTSQCMSCHGTGDYPTENGVADCPDCGGSGTLPSRKVLSEWRMSDIERKYSRSHDAVSTDVNWLISELRNAHTALNQIIALAHDVSDQDSIALRIRFIANRALGLYSGSRSKEPETPETIRSRS